MNKIRSSPTGRRNSMLLSATGSLIYRLFLIVFITTMAELIHRSHIKLYTQVWWTEAISSDIKHVSLRRMASKRLTNKHTLYNADFRTRVLAITPFQRPVWRTFQVYPRGFYFFFVTRFPITRGLTRTQLPICSRTVCTPFHTSQ